MGSANPGRPAVANPPAGAEASSMVDADGEDSFVALGGLSPDQAQALRQDPWDGTGCFVLHEDIPDELIEPSALLVLNAQALLSELRSHGPVKLTEAGYLPRAFVARMLDVMHWPPGELED